jgi:hypothetical protein
VEFVNQPLPLSLHHLVSDRKIGTAIRLTMNRVIGRRIGRSSETSMMKRKKLSTAENPQE